MEENQENKRKSDEKRSQKEVIVKETLANLENGVFETYQFGKGLSEVWDDFVKIRKSDSKERIDFVQCIQCKGLLSFKGDSGTSHLLRHKCPTVRNDGGDTTKFRSLPFDKIISTRQFVTTNIIQYCTSDLISCEAICDSKNFLTMAQSFVLLGHKSGNIDLSSILPSTSQANRAMSKLKTGKEQDISKVFQDCIKQEWCSATIEIQNFENSSRKSFKVVSVSIQHFEHDLKGLEKKFCFSFVLKAEETPGTLREKLIKNFNRIGADKNDLLKMKFVTPNQDLFANALDFPFQRNNCVADTLKDILNDAFRPTSFTDGNDTLLICSGIVKLINSKENSLLRLIEDDDAWKSKILMLRSVIENADHVLKILDDDESDLQFNKRNAEQVISFLEPFVEAIDELTSTSYTTANKILLWHAVLAEHLINYENRCPELTRIVTIATESFGTKFRPTIGNKVDCFLDPRYKSLLMLNETERAVVFTEVRKLLEKFEESDLVVEPSSYVPAAKKNRGMNFEGNSTPKEKGNAKKASRFSRFERNDEEKMDEVAIYLKLPSMTSVNFPHEFGIINKFWKQQKNKLPKLYQLVSSRLHVPACCGNTSEQPCQLMQNLKADTLADYLFVGHNMKSGKKPIFFVS